MAEHGPALAASARSGRVFLATPRHSHHGFSNHTIMVSRWNVLEKGMRCRNKPTSPILSYGVVKFGFVKQEQEHRLIDVQPIEHLGNTAFIQVFFSNCHCSHCSPSIEFFSFESDEVLPRLENSTGSGDWAGSVDVISSHHSNCDSGLLALDDRCRHLGTHWVLQVN